MVDGSASLAAHSLPLMGIGNADDLGLLAVVIDAHYPSWGLGTAVESRAERADRELITPHGDGCGSSS